VADLELFTCARNATLRLTPQGCATSWRRARALPAAEVATSACAMCRGCEVGAGHAGAPEASSQEVRRADRICTRCHRPARKLVYARLCVSCYNREHEVLRGRNARGTYPCRAPAMHAFRATVGLVGAGTEQVALERVTCGLEGLMASLRRPEPVLCITRGARDG
jgi:hypothetical protein